MRISNPMDLVSDRINLFDGLVAMDKFKKLILQFEEESQALNDTQKIFKIPLTNFTVLKKLKNEILELDEIYQVFQRLENYRNSIKNQKWKDYFIDKMHEEESELMVIDEEIKSLKSKFLQTSILKKLEKHAGVLRQYLNYLERLENGNLSDRHWQLIRKETGISDDVERISKFQDYIIPGIGHWNPKSIH